MKLSDRLRHLVAEDRWIPLSIVGFFVGLTILFAYFTYLAVSTFPGLVTDDSYDEGNKYNQVLAMEAAQKRQGWTLKLTYSGAAGEPHPLTVILKDRHHRPIDGARVAVLAQRPAAHAQEKLVRLPGIGDGVYSAPLNLPLGGRWVFDAVAKTKTGRHQEQVQIDLPPSRVQ